MKHAQILSHWNYLKNYTIYKSFIQKPDNPNNFLLKQIEILYRNLFL